MLHEFLSKYQRFRETYFLCIQDMKQCRDYLAASKKKAANSSENLVPIYKTTGKLDMWYLFVFCKVWIN